MAAPAAQEIRGSLAFWVISSTVMEVWVRLGPMMARPLSLGQFLGVEAGLGDVAFVVINDQLQGMPIDAALGVDLLGHHLHGVALRLPQIGGRAGDGKDAAHHIRLGLLGAAATHPR